MCAHMHANTHTQVYWVPEYTSLIINSPTALIQFWTRAQIQGIPTVPVLTQPNYSKICSRARHFQPPNVFNFVALWMLPYMHFENINRNLSVKPKSYMAWCTYFIAVNFHNLINLQQMLHLFFSNELCEQVIKQAILLGSFQPLKTC